jgi:heptaprenyl diphosphate synthase
VTTTVALFAPVNADLPQVDALLRSLADVEFAPLQKMLLHVLAGEGKRLRPALTLLTGKYGDYAIERLAPTAASIELLHTASLVHDDVIDEAPTRRGRETANNLFGNKASVMLGDFMFGHAAHLVASTGSTRLVSLFARTIMQIVTGELQQDLSAYDYSKGLRDYFARIGGKTASLFGAAAEAGALVCGAGDGAIEALREYGVNLGMAFQIVDDILDFSGDEALLGKPVGGDLLSGTLTLPTLLLMERRPGRENPVYRFFHGRRNRDTRFAEALEAVRSSGVLIEAAAVARDYADRAIAVLTDLSNPGGAKEALVDLADYVVSRTS